MIIFLGIIITLLSVAGILFWMILTDALEKERKDYFEKNRFD